MFYNGYNKFRFEGAQFAGRPAFFAPFGRQGLRAALSAGANHVLGAECACIMAVPLCWEALADRS
jgi:hypothetical protein